MTIQDCAAWAAALGTIFATVLTALNLRREAQWRREDEKQRNDNEKQEQAARITAWILTNKKPGQKTEDIIRISNQSFSPWIPTDQKSGHIKEEHYMHQQSILPSCVSLCCNLRHQRTRRAPFSNGLSKNRHCTSSRRMAACCPQGVARNVCSPWRRDSLHRRARRTLDEKRCGTVTREPRRRH